MYRRPTISTPTYTPFPYPTLFRSSDAAVPPAAVATRALSTDWWVHSFSSLTRKGGPGEDASTSATLPAPGGTDEPAAAEDEPIPAYDPRFAGPQRSEEHTSELQSLMRNSYAVFCLKKKKHQN